MVTDETAVDPLLVVHDIQLPEIQPGEIAQVTGVLHRNINLPTIEETAGLDLDEALQEEWEGKTCIVATEISTFDGTG